MLATLLAQRIVSLFVIVFAGFMLVKSHILESKESKVLSKAALNLITPCSVFNAFQMEATSEVLKGLLIALIAAAAIHAFMLLLTWLLKKPMKLTVVELCSMMYPNAGNLIIPLVGAVLGSEWVIYTTAYMVVQQLLVFTHAKTLMSGVPSYDIKSVLKTPTIIAIILGSVCFGTGFRLPVPVQSGLDNIGGMVGGIAMLVTGILIGGIEFRNILKYKRLWLVAVFRLILIPLMVLPLMKLASVFATGETVQGALLIVYMAVSAPSAATMVNFSSLYGQQPEYASLINVVTTLSCIATMPLMVMLFQSVI